MAAKTAIAPTVDGRIDVVWSAAEPCEVIVREALGGGSPLVVELRSLHTEDTLYVLAVWDDDTKSDLRDPYVWNQEAKKYERPSKPDDQFALEFALSGDFDVNMLSTRSEFIADVWHWKAGRGNPNGWVDDKRHVISKDPVEGSLAYDLGGRAFVHVARRMDSGTPAYKSREAPTAYEGDVVDSFTAQEPTASLADVRGKGVHDGARWTLEMSRKLRTGNADDAVIDATKENLCAIAVLDDELYWNHSVSQLLRLRLAD